MGREVTRRGADVVGGELDELVGGGPGDVRQPGGLVQTEGHHVTPPARPALLEGDAPAGLWDTLAAQIHAAGCTLTRTPIPGRANGVTNFATRSVTVADHLSAAQACKTLAHELAHTTMHDGTEYATAAAAPPKSKPKASPPSSATPPGSPPPPTASATSPAGPPDFPPTSRPPPNGSSPPPAPSSTGSASSLSRPRARNHLPHELQPRRPPPNRRPAIEIHCGNPEGRSTEEGQGDELCRHHRPRAGSVCRALVPFGRHEHLAAASTEQNARARCQPP